MHWTPYDPVKAGCQRNNILIITDGGSTGDINKTMTNFVTTTNNDDGTVHNDGDSAVTYASGHTEQPTGGEFECKNTNDQHSLYGSTLLDDLSFYAHDETAYPDIYYYSSIDGLAKKKITTYVVSAGASLKDDGTEHDCNPMYELGQVAENSDTDLMNSEDPSALKDNLRNVFERIGGEPSSGSAASVISNSRSGEGAIFQAVFYPQQEDLAGRHITWAGDVHALWLDELGNIRQDCGLSSCGVNDQDFHLDPTVDLIMQFYTDPISNAARAMSFLDADGNGHIDDPDTPVDNDISLRDIRYVWSAGEWLARVPQADVNPAHNVKTQRLYEGTGEERHIITSINGSTMIDFTPAAISGALGANAYKGYFRAADAAEADDIINYVRGDDTQEEKTVGNVRGYRSRLIDWDQDGTPETWKLGDVVNSTPTVVSSPAEDYDLIYGDTSYQKFRQRYRHRRAMVYAGGNDGGLHAFNAGYYDSVTKTIDNKPPADISGGEKKAYDLGAEMWMFVPKNVIPHLKWLTDADYPHVNYVDMKPYIFDAKIFAPDSDHPGGWGTILVGGLGFGGGDIGVDTDGD